MQACSHPICSEILRSFRYVLELNKEKGVLGCIIKTVLNDPILFVIF